MSEEKHHHHLFHHKKDEDQAYEGGYSQSAYPPPEGGYTDSAYAPTGDVGGYGQSTEPPLGGYGQSTERPVGGYGHSTERPVGGYGHSTEPPVDYEKEEKHHKHKEHLGELGAVAAGAFALVNGSCLSNYVKNIVLRKLWSRILSNLEFFCFFFLIHCKRWMNFNF